jgi:hypothetical protein
MRTHGRMHLARVCLMTAAVGVSLHAGVIRGVVVENFTGKVLARAEVVLQPIAGTPGGVQTKRADSRGAFVFDSLADGAYIVKASRNSFMPAEYGQKRWNSASVPVTVEDAAPVFLNIRLFRYCAIGGTVVDENDEGLPGHDVAAYRDSKPPELIAKTTTDERGVYRLHGLAPGAYVVRTTGMQCDAASYLPTFSKETDTLEQAHTVDLQPDQEANDVDVRPLPGRLYSLSASVATVPPGADVKLTMVSEMGRKTVEAPTFRFAGLPPGDYELFAQVPANPGPGEKVEGAYERISLGRDMSVSLLLRPPSAVTISGAPANSSGEIRIGRKDLAGEGSVSELPLLSGAATIPPGRWKVMLMAPAGYYASGFSGPGLSPAAYGRADRWEEVLSPGRGGRFFLSSGPSDMRGMVKGSDDPIPGVPVYLEAYSPVTRTRIAELRTAVTDMRGQYRFDGLAPGAYRILATFEYLSPDTETMDAAGAQSVTVDAHSELSRDLEIYVIR